MKKLITLTLAIVLTSCGSMKITSFKTNNINQAESACKTPTFVASVAKKSVGIDDLSLYQLLTDAKTQFGSDITIQNINWDVKSGKKVSVIYDVVRCNPEKPD